MSLRQPRLAVFPGEGRIVRRHDALLFDERATNDDLARFFMSAQSTAAAIAAVKAAVVDRSLNVDAFAIVSWTDVTIDLLIFGDLTISTTAPSTPLLSGAASSTWVEHQMNNSLTPKLDEVEVSCGSGRDNIDDLSNLQSGSVFAGGFLLAPDRHAEAEAEAESISLAPPEAEERARVETEVTGDSVAPLTSEDPTDLTPRDPPEQSSGPSLVEAVCCSEGHANRPRSARCVVCDTAILHDGRVTLAPQPVIGRLLFGDGREVMLDRTVALGRRLTHSEEVQNVELSVDEVSRHHADVEVDGWDALLRDLGSRNGTYVTDPESAGPIRLEEGVGHLLESGALIHLGSPEASFTYLAPGD